MRTPDRKTLLRIAGVTGGILLSLVLLLALALWTGPGRSLLVQLVTPLTGGEVVIKGIDGDSPHHLRAASVELRDEKGVWLRIENLVLDWNLFSALGKTIEISNVTAERTTILRKPDPNEEESTSSTQIHVGNFALREIVLQPALLGKRAVLTASGSLRYRSWHDVVANLQARRLDSAGIYRVNASIVNDILTGSVQIAEGDEGVLGPLAGLTKLGPVRLSANAIASGSANRVKVTLAADTLRADADGTLDLSRRTADIKFSANADAMQPKENISWNRLLVQGRMTGSFDKPKLDGTLRLADISIAGVKASNVTADINAANGMGNLQGKIEGLVVPGRQPLAFASAPVSLNGHIVFDAPTRNMDFVVSHPHLTLRGSAQTRGPLTLVIYADITSLAPVASLSDLELDGRGRVNLKITEQVNEDFAVTLDGRVTATERSMLGRLLGNGGFSIVGHLRGNDFVTLRGKLSGTAIAASLDGHGAGYPDYRWQLELKDLSRAASTLTGNLRLSGTLKGSGPDTHLTASGNGAIGTQSFQPENISVGLNLIGFPDPRSGILRLAGQFGGSPLALTARLIGEDNSRMALEIKEGHWKSLQLGGRVSMSQEGKDLRGKLTLDAQRLADLKPVLGEDIEGRLKAAINLTSLTSHLNVNASGLKYGGADIARLDLGGDVKDIFGKPNLDLKLSATGIAAGEGRGAATAKVTGPLSDLSLRFTSKLPLSGSALSLTGNASADLHGKIARLSALSGDWKGQPIRLAKPATVKFGKELVLSDFGLRIGGAQIAASGQISPNLALDFSASNVTLEQLHVFVPDIEGEGTMSLQANLTGELNAPRGTVDITGRGLRLKGMSKKSTKALDLSARAVLHGTMASVDASLVNGQSVRLSLKGDMPLTKGGSAKLAISGRSDLAILAGYLAATGQYVSGDLAIDGLVTGTLVKPRFAGTMKLMDGEFRDFVRGVRLRDMTADISAQGSMLRVTSLTAKAGDGAITGSGTIDLAADGMPISLDLKARSARPIESDRLTVTLNADLVLKGQLQDRMDLTGTIGILKSEINLPDRYPPNVAQLDVRRVGDKPPAPSPDSQLGLDLQIVVPGLLYVRGRGLEAELSGNLKISGRSNQPRVQGALAMRRGTLEVAGKTLTFKSGKVSFDGNSLRYKLDPALEFVAETVSAGITATLKITGYVSAPRLELSSIPSLPQDEVLARLIFQQSVKQLSALQLAELAQAAASLTGLGSGFSPVASLRKTLGLDRLSVGSTSAANGTSGGTTIEAGRYVSPDLYVGGRQTLSGGTRAIVQYDLTQHLKLEATVNAGTSSVTTPSTQREDQGSSVGVTYQFDY